MTNDDFFKTLKYARIIELIAEKQQIPLEEGMDMFTHRPYLKSSMTAQPISSAEATSILPTRLFELIKPLKQISESRIQIRRSYGS